MDQFYRFVAAHRRGVTAVVMVLLCALVFVLELYFDPSLGVLYLLTFLFGFPLIFGVTLCSVKLQNRALKVMVDSCDPYPYLEEMQTRLSYRNSPLQDILLRIDLAMALYNTGSTQVALNVMRNIPIDSKKAANPVIQAIYYNNLAALLAQTGDYAGAEEAWSKFAVLVKGKAKKAFDRHYPFIVILSEADHLYRTGEYAAALEKARLSTPKTAMERVEAAHFRAKCAIALEDHDTARRELNYVIANGNKLAVVSDAWEMLKKLD